MKFLFSHVAAALALAVLTIPVGGATESPAEPAKAQAPRHPLKPMLWKVEGKGLEKPSWLFGTVHVGREEITTLHPAAERAFAGSDALFTEVPMDAGAQLGVAGMLLREDGKTLSEMVGPEVTKQLTAELRRINPLMSIDVMNQFKTWAVAITLPTLKLQLQGEKALDAVLWDRATKAEKSTGALETEKSQLDIFDTLKEEDQAILLAETLKSMREAREKHEDPTEALIAAYIAGDDKALVKNLEKDYQEMIDGEHAELGKLLLKRLITDRNEKMADTIAEELEKNPGKAAFFAVGTAHYLGEGSIRERLTKNGYKITHITE